MTVVDRFPGVAIVAVAMIGEKHAGILYRPVLGSAVKAVHMTPRGMKADDEPSESWRWITPDVEFEEEQLKQLAALCALLAANAENGVAPYGFEMGNSFISSEGRIVVTSEDLGFTCSTFVLAAFDRAIEPLLDLETWRDRDAGRATEDAVAFGEILNIVAKKNKARARAIEGYVDTLRYRPLEVTAASAFGPRPMNFARTQELSSVVMAILTSTVLE